MNRSGRVAGIVVLVAGMLPGCAGPGGSSDLAAANRGELGLVATALVVGHCGRFAGAVARADLSEMLAGEGPFTVLAPTDEAFLLLEARGDGALLEDPETLRAILLHHVVAGEVRAPRLIHESALVPLHGSPLPVSIEEGQVSIAGARVIQGDVVAKNGILHFVDQVLLPGPEEPPREE